MEDALATLLGHKAGVVPQGGLLVISNARGTSKWDIESVPNFWVHIRGGGQYVGLSCVQQE
eukprot:1143656-Pelagomonas_calceolata.AAC.2